MVLNVAAAGALSYQLLRSFWNKQPEFTLISQSMGLHLMAMLKNKFTKKVITSFAGIGYPGPRPCPIVQNVHRSGEVTFENWTMRTIPQRLMVSTDFIRKYSHLVRIPSHAVLAVCEAPFGNHSIGLAGHGLPEIESYFPDYEFALEGNAAAMDEKTFAEWLQEWVLNIKDPDAYLSKLDNQRLVYLKGKAESDTWIPETRFESFRIDLHKPPNDLERLVTTAGKIIEEKCNAKGYHTMLAGIGLPNLAAWLAAYHLKER